MQLEMVQKMSLMGGNKAVQAYLEELLK
jgi:hypothetical protein